MAAKQGSSRKVGRNRRRPSFLRYHSEQRVTKNKIKRVLRTTRVATGDTIVVVTTTKAGEERRRRVPETRPLTLAEATVRVAMAQSYKGNATPKIASKAAREKAGR
jgi:hypothetical protein